MRWLAIVGLALCGCSEKKEQAFDPNDRALLKLQAEKERLEKLPPPSFKKPQEDPLAAAVTRQEKPENLGIPSGVTAQLGDIALTLKEVRQSQTWSNGKVSLSTADRFVEVVLDAHAAKPTDLDLSGALLEHGDQTWPIARDVQRMSGDPLTFDFSADGADTFHLFFELPAESVGKGLKIILTARESRVELSLQ